MTELLFELILGIGSIAIGVLQFLFFAWLAMFSLGCVLGLIMDRYYGQNEDCREGELSDQPKPSSEQS